MSMSTNRKNRKICPACNGTGSKVKSAFKKPRTNPMDSCFSCSGLGIVLKNPAEEQTSISLSRGAALGLTFLGIASLATVAILLTKNKKNKNADDEEIAQEEISSDISSDKDSSGNISDLEKIPQVKDFKIEMIDCPAGSFTMGHVDIADNQPRSEKIDVPFSLGKTEVTQELYQKVMESSNNQFKDDSKKPKAMLSWEEALLFCNKLSELEGLEICYTKKSDQDFDWACNFNKNGYRLPTEKEWEYAAKAGTDNRWAGTNERDDVGMYAWFEDNSSGVTHPVGQKEPNEWGFYDMSGNVKEMCWDKFDPTDTDLGTARVVRGGNWHNDLASLKTSYRSDVYPEDSASDIGFRVARSRKSNG